MSLSPRSKLDTQDLNAVTKGRLPEVHRFEHLTELARKQGEREIVQANNNVKTEYRKRLADTKEMKARMEHCLSTLTVEMGALERCRNDVRDGLKNFEPIIALSAGYTDARKGRPSSPSMYHENVVRAMSQNNAEIKQYICKLAEAISGLEDSLSVLRQCQRDLSGEISTHMTTMIIDNACMEELLTASDIVGAAYDAQKLKSPSVIKQSTKMHTQNEWHNQAESVVSNGMAQIEVSQSRRKKAQLLLRNTKEAGKYNRNPQVLDAFAARMKYNQGQISSLELNIQMITGQIDHLEKQKALVVGSLEKTLQQQVTARQRLDVRALLPSKENTRPNVEVTLEVELANLERNEREFRARLAELDKNLETQKALRVTMKREHKRRSEAYALDKACYDMRLPPLSNEMLIASSSGMQSILKGGSLNSPRSEVVAGASSGASSGRGSARASTANVPRPPPSQHQYSEGSERGRYDANSYDYGYDDGASGRSVGKSSGRSQRSTATGGGYGAAASGTPTLPPIPSPPSPRGGGRQQNADVEALLRSATPTSARSGRGSVRSSRR